MLGNKRKFGFTGPADEDPFFQFYEQLASGDLRVHFEEPYCSALEVLRNYVGLSYLGSVCDSMSKLSDVLRKQHKSFHFRHCVYFSDTFPFSSIAVNSPLTETNTFFITVHPRDSQTYSAFLETYLAFEKQRAEYADEGTGFNVALKSVATPQTEFFGGNKSHRGETCIIFRFELHSKLCAETVEQYLDCIIGIMRDTSIRSYHQCEAEFEGIIASLINETKTLLDLLLKQESLTDTIRAIETTRFPSYTLERAKKILKTVPQEDFFIANHFLQSDGASSHKINSAYTVGGKPQQLNKATMCEAVIMQVLAEKRDSNLLRYVLQTGITPYLGTYLNKYDLVTEFELGDGSIPSVSVLRNTLHEFTLPIHPRWGFTRPAYSDVFFQLYEQLASGDLRACFEEPYSSALEILLNNITLAKVRQACRLLSISYNVGPTENFHLYKQKYQQYQRHCVYFTDEFPFQSVSLNFRPTKSNIFYMIIQPRNLLVHKAFLDAYVRWNQQANIFFSGDMGFSVTLKSDYVPQIVFNSYNHGFRWRMCIVVRFEMFENYCETAAEQYLSKIVDLMREISVYPDRQCGHDFDDLIFPFKKTIKEISKLYTKQQAWVEAIDGFRAIAQENLHIPESLPPSEDWIQEIHSTDIEDAKCKSLTKREIVESLIRELLSGTSLSVLRRVLQTGLSPNIGTYVNRCTLMESVGIFLGSSMEERVNILLDFLGDPYKPGPSNCSAWDHIVNYVCQHRSEFNKYVSGLLAHDYRIYYNCRGAAITDSSRNSCEIITDSEMMSLCERLKLIAARCTRTPVEAIPLYETFTPQGRVLNAIYQEQRKRHLIPQTIQDIKLIPPNTFFMMYDGKRVRVSSRSVNHLTLREVNQLYAIVHERFGKLAEERFGKEECEAKLEEYFYVQVLEESRKENAIIDLGYLDGEIQAFNLYHIKSDSYGGGDKLYYRVILASASSKMADYKRLMSVISFARGFALQLKNLDKIVYTAFELLNVSPFLQVWSLCFYPLYQIFAQEFIRHIAGLFYGQEECHYNQDLLQLEDQLGGMDEPKHKKYDETDIPRPSEVLTARYLKFFNRKERSTVFLFENNERNRNSMANLIGARHVKGKDGFSQFVEDLSKNIRDDGSIGRTPSMVARL